jgi:phenylacetate-CoA ligase
MRIKDRFAPIVRRVIAPLWAFEERSPYLEHLKVLERTQYLDEEKLRRRQWWRLKKIVAHAYSNCPFYTQLYRSHGLSPGELRSWDDFQRLPIVTKKQIRASSADMVATNISKDHLVSRKTSGSTGVSLFFHVDTRAGEWRRACAIRHDRWAGWDIGEPIAAVWGNAPTNRRPRQWLRNHLLNRTRFLDTLHMKREDMESFARDLIARPATLLFGHAHSLFLFALFVRSRGFKGIVPKGIISTAMVLLEKERAVIESVFRTKVFDRYGCEEVSLIASECEFHTGLHINLDLLVVEILRDGRPAKPGEAGEIVVTDLMNYGMPFIRYKVGDMAVPSDRKCPCGRGFPLLERVEGRTADYVVTPDGSLISGISLTENLATLVPGLEQMQIVQEATDFLRLRIVPGEQFGDASVRTIEELIRKRFGPAMRHECELVETIPCEPSGKFRFVISKVPLPFN